MKRTGAEIDLNMVEKFQKLQHENNELKKIVDRDLAEKLQKQNLLLKRQLDKKVADIFLDDRINSECKNKSSSNSLTTLNKIIEEKKPSSNKENVKRFPSIKSVPKPPVSSILLKIEEI